MNHDLYMRQAFDLAQQAKGKFVCVGLDSDISKIPESVRVYEGGYVVAEHERQVKF